MIGPPDHPMDPLAGIMAFCYTRQIKKGEQWLKDTKKNLVMEVLQRKLSQTPDDAAIKLWLEDAEFTHKVWTEVYKVAREFLEAHGNLAGVEIALEEKYG